MHALTYTRINHQGCIAWRVNKHREFMIVQLQSKMFQIRYGERVLCLRNTLQQAKREIEYQLNINQCNSIVHGIKDANLDD